MIKLTAEELDVLTKARNILIEKGITTGVMVLDTVLKLSAVLESLEEGGPDVVRD